MNWTLRHKLIPIFPPQGSISVNGDIPCSGSSITKVFICKMADIDEMNIDEEIGYEFESKIPEIITDDMNESGYQEGSETSFGDRRDSKELCEGDSDSGVDGVSSGCSTVDDCPVVSINDVVAYYDDIRPRRRHVPQLNFYHVDIERMALDAVAQVGLFFFDK